MLKEFKAFAMKGNIIDLAVAVVIGAAFGKIVSSLVADVITPLIGVITGGVDFTKLVWKVGEAQVKYGQFLQNIFDFVVIALAIFIIIVKVMGSMKKKEEPKKEEPKGPTSEELLVEIRDLLKKQ
ncbi:large-conductance mechanosensitive channel protein MscL [Candidatus Gracilibacteria bacterium]|nr:large-conductance mechanosensitive channel protein MscL [Candidatus Gracilibacteria bacterium]